MGVEVDDRAFQADFKKAMSEFEQFGVQDIETRANRIAERAREFAHRASGETRRKIKVVAGTGSPKDGGSSGGGEGSSHYREIRAEAPQSVFEELGTSEMPAIPFIRPAIAEEK